MCRLRLGELFFCVIRASVFLVRPAFPVRWIFVVVRFLVFFSPLVFVLCG